MGYLMKMKNIDAAYDQFLAYADPGTGVLAQALESLRGSIEAFHHMDSFKGNAATALKGYLMDTHTVVIASIVELCAVLETDYAVKYMQRYVEVPIGESGNAVLPEDELEQKRSLLAQAKDIRIPSLDEELRAVVTLLPAPGPWPAVPSAGNLHAAFAAAHNDIEQLKNEVRCIEEEGQRLFTSGDGLFAQLLSQLKGVIQKTALDAAAIPRYEEGSFFMDDDCIALSALCKQASAERVAIQEALIGAKDRMFERQLIREEEAFQILEDGRNQWELVGIGASVIGTLAAAAAIFGTGGTAAFVAGAGALKSLSGTVSRIQDYANGTNATLNSEDSVASSRGSSLADSAVVTATSVASRLASGSSGSSSAQAFLTGAARNTVSITGKASQAVTVLADENQSRMRQEAQERLQRIETLKARRASVAA